MSAPDSHQFGNIQLSGKDQQRDENSGTLKVHAGGFGWKSRKTGNIISVQKADLRGVEWLKIPHAYQLKLRVKGGFVYKFNGFRSQDKDTIKMYCKDTFEADMEDVHMSYKGWNWGEGSIEGQNIVFKVEKRLALEIPLSEVTQATAVKNEAVIEMADDDTAMPDDEVLVEMRLHVPAPTGEEAADMDGTAAENFVNQIKEGGDLEKAGLALASFEDVPIQVPRGRYEVEMFDKFMKLHGKTFDYKVMYSNVSALYLLPKPDGYHMALCITLEHALRQGQTQYPHVILQLPKDTPLEVTINLEEDEIQERFGEKLSQIEAGDMPSVIAKVFSAFTKRKVIALKKDGFNGGSKAEDDRATSIRCSVKANEGQLYPLDKCFFFIANKPMVVDFDKVGSVEFNRVQSNTSSARTFDITVHMKDGTGVNQFVNLQRNVYKELYRFLTEKKIRIKNVAANSNFGDADGDDDDEVNDPYMERMKREREQADMAEDDDDDDEDESDDDFAPGAESDIDEEFDEGDVDDDERAAPKKAKKGSDDEDAEDDEDDEDEEESRPLKKAKQETSKASKPKKEAKAPKAPKEEKGKKKKKKKDKDAPKSALSAYMFFMNRNREKIKEANPEASFGDLGRLAGAQWKEMDAEGKSEYEQAAREDKERYKREMDAYKAKLRAAVEDDGDDDDDAPAAGSDDDADE